MTSFRSALPFAVLVATLACTPKPSTLAPASPADAAAVAKIQATFDSCARTGALDVFMSYSDDDVVMLPQDQPAVVGKQAVREYYRNFYGTFNIEMKHVPGETFSVGNLVISRPEAAGSITPKDGGPTITFNNKAIMLFRRQPDGALKVWRVAFNSNAPPAPPAPAPKK